MKPEEVSSSILQGGLEGVRKVMLADLASASIGGRGILRLVAVGERGFCGVVSMLPTRGVDLEWGGACK